MENRSNKKFSIQSRFNSFGYAFNGLSILIKEEHNARIHLLVTGVVVVSGYFFDITMSEWIAILLSISMVLTLETVNTAIENMADFISPEKHEKIERIKDLSAAAVFLASLCAFLVGTIIFIPKIMHLFFS